MEELKAIVIATLPVTTLIVGAFAGAFANNYYKERNEKRRVQEGYREKVYERVVESIITVHQAFAQYWHTCDVLTAGFLAFADNPDLVLHECDNFKKVLKENKLYYPTDLYSIAYELNDLIFANATEGYCDENVDPILLDKHLIQYTDLAKKKINILGLEILNIEIEKNTPDTRPVG